MQNSSSRATPRLAAALPWVGALAIAFAAPAAAQQNIRGQLRAGDTEYARGRVQDAYPVRVRAGTRLDVRSFTTMPLQTTVLLQSPSAGLVTMDPDVIWNGDEPGFSYKHDITQTETVTVLVVGMLPVNQEGGSGDYTISIEAPGGGLVQAGGSRSPRVAETAPPAPRPPVSVPAVITQQLEGFVELVGRNGFRLVNPEPLAGALNGGTQEDLPLALTARQYLVVGVCDGDCTDMDLRLLDGQGNTVAQDVADDDTPLLVFTVQASGSHVLRVMMPACGADPCFYGISIFAK